MTIAFLGAVGEERAHNAWASMIHAEDGSPRALVAPFELTLGAVMPFGQPSQPSSLSVVPKDEHGPATQFITKHRNRLREAAGISLESRAVRPHATIVRIKRRAAPDVRESALSWAASVPSLDTVVTLSEVALYTWTDDRREQLFRIVERSPLG
jgi:2'-5' RNA ligase